MFGIAGWVSCRSRSLIVKGAFRRLLARDADLGKLGRWCSDSKSPPKGKPGVGTRSLRLLRVRGKSDLDLFSLRLLRVRGKLARRAPMSLRVRGKRDKLGGCSLSSVTLREIIESGMKVGAPGGLRWYWPLAIHSSSVGNLLLCTKPGTMGSRR